MGIDLATWRARIGLNYCRRHAGQSRYSCRPFPVLGRTARWRVEEVINSTPLLLQGCMAVVSLSLILGYRFRGRTFWRCGCGKVGRPKLRDGSVPNAEVGGMADTGIIGVCLLLGVCTVVLALLLMAGDVERNPGPTGKEGSHQVDKVLPNVDDTPLGQDDHFDILTEMMPVASSWKAIGRGLRIGPGRLNMIQESNSGKPRECLSEMLTCWLKRNYNVERFGEPTWRAVVKVVAHPAAGDNCALAQSIAKKHPKPHSPSPIEVISHQKRSRKVEGTEEGVKRRKEDKEQHQKNAHTHTTMASDTASQISEQILFKDWEDSCPNKPMSGDMSTSGTSTQRIRSQRPPFGCGCGNCTFLSYIENGCPDPVPQTSQFPYLNVSGLTHEQQWKLRSRLCVESQEIMFKFQQLFSRVYKSLCEQKVTVDTLVTHLLSLGALDPVSKKSQKPLLQTFFQELQNAGRIKDVLWVIRDYFSFFNYHVIEHIVNGLGTDQDKLELQNYKQHFHQYSKRRIYECPPVYGPMSSANHAKLVLKVDLAYEHFTVEELENFRYRLSKIFYVSPQSVLRLCQVEEGCLQFIFQVPLFVQQEIFPLFSEQERALEAEGVIRLTCGSYLFAAKEHDDGSESEDTESVAELTTHDIDADSAMGFSIITFDRSWCWFSDDEEDPLFKQPDELEELSEYTPQVSSKHQITENVLELHHAARSGDLVTVKFLTNNKPHNPLQKDKYGDTALHAAAQGGSLNVLKYFIEEENCTPGCLGRHGRTPLLVATEHAHLDVVKYLVTEQQVEPLCQDASGWTSLHLSCKSGCLSIVKFLTEEMQKYEPMKDLMPSLTTKKNLTPLHVAATNGHLDIIQLFITDLKCNPNISGHNGHHPLHDAAEVGHLHIMKYLIDERGCDPSCLDKYNETSLHVAAYSGHLDIVKFLTLEKHCNPTTRNSSGATPIHFAALCGHLEILKFFITDLKCSPNIPGKYGRTPLHSAAERSHLHIMKYLIDGQGCKPSCLDSNKQTPLHLAAHKGHIDIVKFLTLEKHCNPTYRNSSGSTPIHVAAQYGHLEILNFFITNQKYSPIVPDKYRRTALHYAAEGGHLYILKYFINEQGCDPSCLDEDNQTPLHLAAEMGHLDIVKFLTLKKHCNPASRNCFGTTPIHWAAHHGHLEILKFFIDDLNCSPSIPGQYGRTPLHSAAGGGHLHNFIIKYLIDEQGCDPSCLDEDKQTPLHRAACKGHLDIVKFLTLEKRCTPYQRDIRKNTPLHYAAGKGHLQVVQFFVEDLKCPPNLRGQRNATPHQMAETKGHHNVTRYLLNFQHFTDQQLHSQPSNM